MPALPEEIDKLVAHPKVEMKSTGQLTYVRRPRKGREADWCKELLERYSQWHDLVDLPPHGDIEAERPISPVRERWIHGCCRADAIIWHSKNECSILEAKTDCAPTAVSSGIGQLLYYRTLVERYWGVKVHGLVLAAPEIPHMLLEMIADSAVPVRFLRRTDSGEMNGLVPHHG